MDWPLSAVGSGGVSLSTTIYDLPSTRPSTAYLDLEFSRSSAYHLGLPDTGRPSSSYRLLPDVVVPAAQLNADLIRHHHRHLYSSDSDENLPVVTPPLRTGAGSFHSGSNVILDEYFQYKSSPIITRSLQFPTTVGEVLTTSPVAVKPPHSYHYPRLSTTTTSSAISSYDEADMKSFLAQRNARRPPHQQPSSHFRSTYFLNLPTSFNPRQRSLATSSVLDVEVLGGGFSRPYSAGKTPSAELAGGSPSPLLPASAYIGRWYTAGNYQSPAAASRRHSHLVTSSLGDVSDDDDLVSGAVGMRSVGRTIATRVTAPATLGVYGSRSGYARSRSVSRLM